jgi:glycosyltransferase involved in cell wall biosynthesis
MTLFSIFKNPVGTVAVNLRPRAGSWGGANQWTSQVVRWFRYQGWRVVYDLRSRVDAVVMTHTGMSSDTSFGADEVEAFREKWPGVPCVHRINDNDIRKETSEMDGILAKSNRVADHTVFVSEWLRDYHGERWFDLRMPHSVIVPGADPRFFHPIGGARWDGVGLLRLVTHHWSDNWKKGFDVYRDIDELAAGSMHGEVELRVIGRWPKDLVWKKARTFGPASGGELAGLLRQCHGYVSASRFEPGAMHVAEGLQCGLPLLYHKDTGGTVEQGRRYGLEIGADLEATLREFRARHAELRSKVLGDPPSGSTMAASYLQLIERLLANA